MVMQDLQLCLDCHNLCAHMWKTHLKIQFAIPFEKSPEYSSIESFFFLLLYWCNTIINHKMTLNLLYVLEQRQNVKNVAAPVADSLFAFSTGKKPFAQP